MEKVYGLQIGDVGFEFARRKARSDALTALSWGTVITITPKHQPGPTYTRRLGEEPRFALYERENEFSVVRCNVCSQLFDPSFCSERDYPFKHPIGAWETFHNYICDDCHTQRTAEEKTDEFRKEES